MENPVIVEILPTRVWIESGIFGERAVVVQHQGCQPFDYAVFNYHHYYTDNAGTFAAATKLALELGATEPVEQRPRARPPGWDVPVVSTPLHMGGLIKRGDA